MKEIGSIYELDLEPEKDNQAQEKPRKKMGRPPGRVMALTTMKRKIEVISPTDKFKADVLKKAKSMGISTSKFMVMCAAEHLNGPDPSSKQARNAKNKIAELEAEIATLKQEKAQQAILIENLTNDIAVWRTSEKSVLGARTEFHRAKLNGQLIALFKKKREVRSIDIVESLKIDITDRKASAALWKDLEDLKGMDLIETTVEGWKWLGK